MKRVPTLAAVLGLALASGAALNATAQTAAPASAKVAVIAFQAAVTATNEFQRDFGDVQKKFEPQRSQLQQLGQQIDSETKALQTQGASLNDSERAARAKDLDDKKKQAQRLAEDAQSDYQQAIQETFGRVAVKVDQELQSYAKEHGFTLVIDGTQNEQQAPLVLYAAPTTDITKAVVEAYNTKSGIPAPPPAAPTPQSSVK